MRRALAALVTIATLLGVIAAPSSPAAAQVHLTPPVEAPVLDPFRPPEGPYGPGNRGIEYDTEIGQFVVAAADGTVVFAGAVARTLHVTIDHGGGLLSSYSFLERTLVRVGDRVDRGDRVGIAGPTFHFGVRLGGEYVDPESLMRVAFLRVRLIGATGPALAVAEPAIRPTLRPETLASTRVPAPVLGWYRVVVLWYRLLSR